ncbi:hypothetical protein BOVATA_040500 [Babesia ovata]|uniref:Uncharacterized protein n=1 Tax=Babesia ovata TaxID=189622 RepID=A0A2H6KHT3_9APIC|nr:uncharacterized protein BOVATA_040500 [Babesia ovata]GBE62557.1 hypothetical protein BOVATA_040500 [Babesia ovata]
MFAKLYVTYISTVTNLPSRRCNRRLGRSLDLLLSLLVELSNGGGEVVHRSGKLLFDFGPKIIFNLALNHFPNHRQLTVHGLRGAYIWIGALVGSSSRGELFVKFSSLINYSIQFACDASFAALFYPVVAEQDRVNFVRHLTGGSGETQQRGFDCYFQVVFATFIRILNPLENHLRKRANSLIPKFLIKLPDKMQTGFFHRFNGCLYFAIS